MSDKPSLKSVFDAYSSDSEADGGNADWRAEVLANADPRDLERVR